MTVEDLKSSGKDLFRLRQGIRFSVNENNVTARQLKLVHSRVMVQVESLDEKWMVPFDSLSIKEQQLILEQVKL